MYLAKLKLWNFRKYGDKKDILNLDTPHFEITFQGGLNVLIGENDSGKTAIIDAIKLVLKTHAYEWIMITDEDFYNNKEKFRIELEFKGLKPEEAKNFIEWLGWEGKGDKATPILRLIYEVQRKNGRILPQEIRAGMDEVGLPLSVEAREYLKTTYLKPLRDAENELCARKNSRLSQILQGHELFQETEDDKHELTKEIEKANKKIQKWFGKSKTKSEEKSNKERIKDVIDDFLEAFIDNSKKVNFTLAPPEIKAILEKITLGINDSINLGLGTLNRLYMATELLHLRKEWDGLKLCMVEELEAHLHPQAQMKVIEALEKERDVQFILTTHSPNLASKVNLENIIICKGENASPLDKSSTKLELKNYKYLERFLDVTKANLFFSKGVIIVEGWSEEILIPSIARKLGYDLTKYGVSIVNVGSTAYLHFAKIFLRKNKDEDFGVSVSVITDLDVKPNNKGEFNSEDEEEKRSSIEANFNNFDGTDVELFIAKQWTLEWCLYKSSLSSHFKEAISEVHNDTDEFKKDDQSRFKNTFESKLIQKLTGDGASKLDKVQVANRFAESLDNGAMGIDENDKYLEYIVKAIKHACSPNDEVK